jgi:hypothetical protein
VPSSTRGHIDGWLRGASGIKQLTNPLSFPIFLVLM